MENDPTPLTGQSEVAQRNIRKTLNKTYDWHDAFPRRHMLP